MGEGSLKVMVVDKYPLFGGGIEQALQQENNLVFTGQATKALKIEDLCQRCQPDLLIFSFNVFPLIQADMINLLRIRFPVMRILVVASQSEGVSAKEMIDRGANGCIERGATITEFALAIHQVLNGKLYVSYTEISCYQNQLGNNLLTQREQEIVILSVKGKSCYQIADELNLSLQTVRNYRSQIYRKLGLQSISELTAWFWQ